VKGGEGKEKGGEGKGRRGGEDKEGWPLPTATPGSALG